MRIDQHPILEFDRGEKVTFFYNGQEIDGYTEETIAAALHAAGIRTLGHSPAGPPPMTRTSASLIIPDNPLSFLFLHMHAGLYFCHTHAYIGLSVHGHKTGRTVADCAE